MIKEFEAGTFTLNNGVEMPKLGFGTYAAQESPDFTAAMDHAVETGFRLFDTASMYGNQIDLGNYFANNSGLDRDNYWLTSKVGQQEQGYEETLAAFKNTTKELQTDYLDLYLVHWPKEKHMFQTWKALEHLYKEGYVRAIGVSNFEANHLDRLMLEATVMPAVDQVETHPYFNNHVTRDYMQSLGIQHQAWSPLGQAADLKDPLIITLAEKYGKTPAQIVLKWHNQNGTAVIPKSTNNKRITENATIGDFTLNPHDMALVNLLNRGERIMGAPDENYVNDLW
ncbi:aldo/keto reductase [Periweissella cryptocerci]|uniref:Aldo/keto reductase n=1 Tax=Periweissella cryptocerci TaxID=2506420 RepID=A0A4P6YUL3_9LACO|nr:aldo/keto reductase [Periweissella cryptocerci]QBO36421.1 aldo/keto reductase [Periweissella cryptocerci]